MDDWLDELIVLNGIDDFLNILDMKESDVFDYGILKFNNCFFMNRKFVSIL